MFEKQTPGHLATGAPEMKGTGAPGHRATDKKPRTGMPGALRWTMFLFLGIAVTAAAGYLVAALVFFPAPLLPSERQVARVTGMTENEARRELEKQGLTAAVTGREPHPTLPTGAVLWQDPTAGVAVPRGTIVALVLSAGLPRVVVPDVRQYDIEFAQRLLMAAGLRVDGIDSLDVKGVPSGAAGSTNPAAGDSVLIGHSVQLHIAR
jgi:serine/threonine-protein kinase